MNDAIAGTKNMETLIYIPKEEDVKRWIKEAIYEYFMEERNTYPSPGPSSSEPLISRKEMAKNLEISLVTLTDWVKRGLPCHKNRGRVYFLRSEVVAYMKSKKRSNLSNKE